MPGMNRTGPLGSGPMSGRGMGLCGGGRGTGAGRGMGMGRGRGFFGLNAGTADNNRESVLEQKIEELASKIEELQKNKG